MARACDDHRVRATPIAVAEEERTDDDGIVHREWRLEATGPYTSAFGAKTQDHTVWLERGLIVRQSATSTYEGVTLTVVDEWSDYGTAVEIPAAPEP